MATVGQIVAYITGDDSDFRKTANAVNARADELGRKRPKIVVQIDAVKALAQLDALKVANLKLQTAEQRLGELRQKSGVKASVLTSAEAGLAAAQARVAAAEGALSVSADRASKAQ